MLGADLNVQSGFVSNSVGDESSALKSRKKCLLSLHSLCKRLRICTTSPYSSVSVLTGAGLCSQSLSLSIFNNSAGRTNKDFPSKIVAALRL